MDAGVDSGDVDAVSPLSLGASGYPRSPAPDVNVPDVFPNLARDLPAAKPASSSVVAPIVLAVVPAMPIVAPTVATVAPITSGASPTVDTAAPTAAFLPGARSVITPVSAVVPSVALRHLRDRIARRDSEYTDLEDRFALREVDIERLTGEVQSLTEQVASLRTKNEARQRLLTTRLDDITSLRRELADLRARPSASAEALAAKTHKCDQLRQSAGKHRLDAEQCRRLLSSFSQQIEILGQGLGRASAELNSG